MSCQPSDPSPNPTLIRASKPLTPGYYLSELGRLEHAVTVGVTDRKELAHVIDDQRGRDRAERWEGRHVS